MEQKNNTGIAFKNLTPKNEKSPAYKGTLKVNNTEYNIGLWVKTSKSGSKFLTIAVVEKQYRQPTSAEESFNDAKREEPKPKYIKTEDIDYDIALPF